MSYACVLATCTEIRAFRTGRYLLIVAKGTLPSPGFRPDIRQDPRRIFPPQFDVLRCPIPGIFPDVLTPFIHAEPVIFPADHPTVTVHHEEGSDDVRIEECPRELATFEAVVGGRPDQPCPEGVDEAVGFSTSLSFDDAFARALSALPPTEPPYPDALARVQVVEVGGLFGGFAGFHDLFVRLQRRFE